jgi:hypothetical protein
LNEVVKVSSGGHLAIKVRSAEDIPAVIEGIDTTFENSTAPQERKPKRHSP